MNLRQYLDEDQVVTIMSALDLFIETTENAMRDLKGTSTGSQNLMIAFRRDITIATELLAELDTEDGDGIGDSSRGK